MFAGTLNLAPGALVRRTEVGMVFPQPAMAPQMSDWFDQEIDKLAFRPELVKNDDGTTRIPWHGNEDGERRTFDVEPYTGFWERFGVGFLRLLPIESQL